MITWNVPIWVYLWMAGMAGGAYFAAFLAERFTGGTNEKLLRLATYIGIPLVAIGVILLIIDLGMPLHFWHLLVGFEPLSPMSLGTWILTIWACVAVAMIVLWFVENSFSARMTRILKMGRNLLSMVALVFSVLIMAYTGVLLASSNQPLWSGTFLLPSLFVVSATSTGVAIVVAASLIANMLNRGGPAWMKSITNKLFGSSDWTISNRMIGHLAEADVILIFIEIAVLIGYSVWLSVSAMEGTSEALSLLTTGSLALPFWLGVALLALLLPLGLEIAVHGKEIKTRAVWLTIMASSACVILGGLVLRAVIVIGGQM